MANYRYKVALAIYLSFKASSIFPDREFWLKMVQNRNFWENRKNLANREILQKLSFSLFQCVLNIKIYIVSKFRRKILIFEEITAYSIYKGLAMKKWSKI